MACDHCKYRHAESTHTAVSSDSSASVAVRQESQLPAEPGDMPETSGEVWTTFEGDYMWQCALKDMPRALECAWRKQATPLLIDMTSPDRQGPSLLSLSSRTRTRRRTRAALNAPTARSRASSYITRTPTPTIYLSFHDPYRSTAESFGAAHAICLTPESVRGCRTGPCSLAPSLSRVIHLSVSVPLPPHSSHASPHAHALARSLPQACEHELSLSVCEYQSSTRSLSDPPPPPSRRIPLAISHSLEHLRPAPHNS